MSTVQLESGETLGRRGGGEESRALKRGNGCQVVTVTLILPLAFVFRQRGSGVCPPDSPPPSLSVSPRVSLAKETLAPDAKSSTATTEGYFFFFNAISVIKE